MITMTKEKITDITNDYRKCPNCEKGRLICDERSIKAKSFKFTIYYCEAHCNNCEKIYSIENK